MPPTLSAKGRMAMALDDLTLRDVLDVLTDRYHPVEVAEAAVEVWTWWPDVPGTCTCDRTLHTIEDDAHDEAEAEWLRGGDDEPPLNGEGATA